MSGGGVGLLYDLLSAIGVVLGGWIVGFIGLLRLSNGAKVSSYFQLIAPFCLRFFVLNNRRFNTQVQKVSGI